MIRIVVLLLILCLPLVSFADGDPVDLSDEQKASFEKAEDILTNSHSDPTELAKAQDLYAGIIAKNPKHSDSWLGLAKVVKALGYQNGYVNYQVPFINHAFQFINHALEADPKSSLAQVEMAHSYIVLKDFKKADEWIEKAKKDGSKDAKVWRFSALNNFVQHKFKEGIGEIDKGLKVAKSDMQKAQLFQVKGQYLGENKDPKGMLESDLAAAELLPKDPWLQGNVAAAYAANQNWDKCAEWAAKALNLMNYGNARRLYWSCSIENRKNDQALNMKWRAPKKQDTADTMISQREYFARFKPVFGEIPESVYRDMYELFATNEISQVGQDDLEDADKYFRIAWKYATVDNNFKESIVWTDKALKITPNDYPLINHKIQTLMFSLHDLDGALKFATEAAKAKLKPEEQSTVIAFKAQLECSFHKTEECGEDAKTAITLNPDYMPPYDLFNGAYVETLKKYDLVSKFYQEIEPRAQKSKAYFQWRAYFTIIHDKDLDKAEGLLKHALEIDPDYSSAYYRMAFVDFQRGDKEKALSTIKIAIDKKLPQVFFVQAKLLIGSITYSHAQEKKSRTLMKTSMDNYSQAMEADPRNQQAKDGYDAAKAALASMP